MSNNETAAVATQEEDSFESFAGEIPQDPYAPYANVNWSSQQQEIISWAREGTGNTVVIARAGCGKTFTLVYAATQAPESKIFQCSYGADISAELKKKVLSGEASTLHSAGLKQIRTARKGAITISNKVEYSRIRTVREKFINWVSLDCRGFAPGSITWATSDKAISTISDVLSWVKNTSPFASTLKEVHEITLATVISEDCSINWDLKQMADYGAVIKEAIMIVAMLAKSAMELAVEQFNAKAEKMEISYDDMLWLPVRTRTIRPLFELIFADEVQDFNSCMLELVQSLLLPGGRMCMIGDPMQSLYAFRGADPEAMPRMIEKLNAQIFHLTVTRRCPALVVELAKAIVPDFTAAPDAPEGYVKEVEKGFMVANVNPGDFILSRTNAALAKVCMGLLKNKIRAYIVGRDIGVKLTGILKKIGGKNGFSSLEKMFDKIDSWMMSETEKITKQDLPDKKKNSLIEDITDQVGVFKILAEDCSTPDEVFGQISSIFADPDSSKKEDFVACSTVHRAKGLERETVWVLENSFTRPQSPQEDRIRYVCITRSKLELYLVYELVKDQG